MADHNGNAGVVVATRFVDKSTSGKSRGTKVFAGYIDYIDRDQAVRNENFTKFNLSSMYESYNDYMDNPDKTGGLFTASNDSLDAEQKKALKRAFKAAYDSDGIMWQTVISFENTYLAKLGLYDPISKSLNESMLQDVTRQMMREALSRENMSHSAVWSAAIHYNTDNIHIHVAYVEPVSTRPIKMVGGVEQPKGYFHRATLRAMKSKVVNGLLENDYAKLDNLVRGRFLHDRKDFFSPEDKNLRALWVKIYSQLPGDRRQWYYNMNTMKPLHPLIDQLTREYLKTYHAEDLGAFQKMLMEQQTVYEMAYGKNSHYKDFASNKMKDLYARMGNVTLAEMREFSKATVPHPTRPGKHLDMENALTAYRLHGSLGKLKGALNQAFQDYAQNEMAYRKLQAEIKYMGD